MFLTRTDIEKLVEKWRASSSTSGRMGYENTILGAFDIQRALRSVFEGDDDDYMMSAQAARALIF